MSLSINNNACCVVVLSEICVFYYSEQLYVFYTGSFRIQSSSKCANYLPKITPLTLRLQNAESRSLDPGIFGFFSIVRQDRLGISHHIFSDTYPILFRKYRRHCLGVLHKITNTWNSLKVRKEFSVSTDVCSLWIVHDFTETFPL